MTPAPAHATPRPPAARWPGAAALALAIGAMVAVHVSQPGFPVWQRPLSYHVHGRAGWWLIVALGAFGWLLLMFARQLRTWNGLPGQGTAVRGLIGSGIGLLVAAAFPSDAWFPWERTPSIAGLVHAVAGVLAPAALLLPMAVLRRYSRWLAWLGALYAALVVGCGVLLAVGWATGGPPPAIGAAERALGGVAVAWAFVLWRWLARPAPTAAPAAGGAAPGPLTELGG